VSLAKERRSKRFRDREPEELELRIVIFLGGAFFALNGAYFLLRPSADNPLWGVLVLVLFVFSGLWLIWQSVVGTSQRIERLANGFGSDLISWCLLLLAFPLASLIRHGRERK
jgi:membrane associated rhomboid family serine protease